MVEVRFLEEGFAGNLDELLAQGRDIGTIRLLTAHPPAIVATTPPEIIIGLTPLVDLKIIPLSAPAAILFAASCLPLKCPIKELKPLYTIAITPAELPKNGPLRVTEFSTPLRRSFGGCPAVLRSPSCNPHAPPRVKAERYDTPVP